MGSSTPYRDRLPPTEGGGSRQDEFWFARNCAIGARGKFFFPGGSAHLLKGSSACPNVGACPRWSASAGLCPLDIGKGGADLFGGKGEVLSLLLVLTVVQSPDCIVLVRLMTRNPCARSSESARGFRFFRPHINVRPVSTLEPCRGLGMQSPWSDPERDALARPVGIAPHTEANRRAALAAGEFASGGRQAEGAQAEGRSSTRPGTGRPSGSSRRRNPPGRRGVSRNGAQAEGRRSGFVQERPEPKARTVLDENRLSPVRRSRPPLLKARRAVLSGTLFI
jgi:hypothetical protein